MNMKRDGAVRDIHVPRSLMNNPDFGGRRDGDCQRGTLLIRDGRVVALQSDEPTSQPRMVLPKLTEAHCHLDKCHSLHRLGDVGGDLMMAIEAQAEDKANWTRRGSS